jgi:hypothetical protein
VIRTTPCTFNRKRRGICHIQPESIRLSFDSVVSLIHATRPDVVIGDWHFTAAAACQHAGIPLVQVRNAFWQALYDNGATASTADRDPEYRYWITHWSSAIADALPTASPTPLRGDAELIADLPALFGTTRATNPRTTRWIGALTPPSPARPTPRRQPSICLSIGGHGHDKTSELLRAICQRLGVTVTINRPERSPCSLDELGSSPLATSSAVVTHGGSGSCYQAIRLRKPLVVVPRTIEHSDYGQRLAASGAAVCLSESPTSASLSNAITAVLSDRRYRRCAADLGRMVERLTAMTRDAYLDITRSLSLG